MPNGTVLVIEDDADTTDLLETILQDRGYSVLASSDGEALHVAAAQQPDVILLDLMMPGMDGLEVGHRLRADPTTARIPLIAVSVMQPRAHAAARALVDEWVVKPFHVKDMAEVVARWMPQG